MKKRNRWDETPTNLTNSADKTPVAKKVPSRWDDKPIESINFQANVGATPVGYLGLLQTPMPSQLKRIMPRCPDLWKKMSIHRPPMVMT